MIPYIVVPIVLAVIFAFALDRWGRHLHHCTHAHSCDLRESADNPWPDAFLLQADLDEFERQLKGGAV